MKIRLAFCLLCLLPTAMPAPAAASEKVDAILEAQRLRGYRSPLAAIEQLQAASDVPGDDAPLEKRRRYHAALGQFSTMLDRPDLTADSVAHLKAMAEDEGCRPCRVQMLVIQARADMRRKDPDAAQKALQQATALAPVENMALRLELGDARARLLNLRGDLPKALAEAFATLPLAEKLGNAGDRVHLMALIVSISANLNYFDRAKAMAEETLALAEPMGFRYVVGYLRLSLCNVFVRTGQREQLLVALRQALEVSVDEPGLAEIEAIARANLSDYHLTEHEYQAALEQADRAVILAEASGERMGLVVAMANQGIALAGLGRVEAGVLRLRQANAKAEEIDHKVLMVALSNEMVRILEEAGRYREALETMHKVADLDQQITTQKREKAVAELQAKYDTERKTREIEQLAGDNRIKQAELSARIWQQRLWAALAAALIFGAALLMLWLRRARRSNQQLQVDNRALTEMSVHDPLTGAFNRRHCQNLMAQQEALLIAHAPGQPASVGLVLLDLDCFKDINDSHGHAIGDAVLVVVCQRLQKLLRQQDAVVRWGGEEFVVVLPGVPADGLMALAERVLHAVGGTPVEAGARCISVTASAGCVAYPFFPGQHWEDALHVADMALYKAKAEGRNRAVCLPWINPDAYSGRLKADLSAAQAAGDIELRVVHGPVPAVAQFVAID